MWGLFDDFIVWSLGCSDESTLVWPVDPGKSWGRASRSCLCRAWRLPRRCLSRWDGKWSSSHQRRWFSGPASEGGGGERMMDENVQEQENMCRLNAGGEINHTTVLSLTHHYRDFILLVCLFYYDSVRSILYAILWCILIFTGLAGPAAYMKKPLVNQKYKPYDLRPQEGIIFTHDNCYCTTLY